MTICIAAIAKEGKDECIVLATDHMVTMGTINQFEHKIKKYKIINKTTVALLSGQFLMFDELIQLPNRDLCYSEIANEISCNFKNKRKDCIKNEILDKSQIDSNFVLNCLSQPDINPVMAKIIKAIYDYRLNTTILLARFEGNVARISEIDEERIEPCRDLYFTTTGIGYEAAYNTLLYQQHNRTDPLKKAIYNVYKAKRSTEHLTGIGKETEILILNKDGLKSVKDLKPLEEVFTEELDHGKEKAKQLKLEFENGGV